MTRAHGLFAVGAGVVAVHVADDAFLQPQPGTGPGDHLAGGLVPLFLLALATWAFPRLRGARAASVALVTGLFGVVAGVEAIHYASTVGPAGDDFTGLAAVPAGLLLIGLGLHGLWTTRRATGHRAWRYGRRVVIAVAAVFAAALVAMPAAIGYIGTHVGRAVVPEAALGVPYEDVAFTTDDGLRLHGWYVPSRNGAAVIAFPGRKGPQRQARLLARHGYGVLLFDRRGEGESEGDPNGWGWGGQRDIDAAVAFLRSRPDVDPGRIAGIGLSVGGELMLEAAAGNRGLAAVVAEGAGARSAADEISDVDGGLAKLGAAIAYGARDAVVVMASGRTPPARLETLLPRIAPRPVFLIGAAHGEVGHKLADYVAAAREPKEAWVVPRGGHTGAIDAMPQEYERRVIAFLDRALG
jgi:dienelactone hydrolase